MKEKMYKVLSHLFQYVGTKQLVMSLPWDIIRN